MIKRVKFIGQTPCCEGTVNGKAEIEGTGTHSVAFNLNDLESGKFRIYAYSETPSVTGDASYIEAPSPE